MRTYDKIEGIYARDLAGSKKIMEGVFRNESVEYLKDLAWLWTEKVDGTNVRVGWDGHKVSFAGRTDQAQFPPELLAKLTETFGTEEAEQVFEQQFGERNVILFGEGYGRKIQRGGGLYIPDGVGFILFDLLVGDNYQTRENVELCAQSFGVPCVPIVGAGDLDHAVKYVKSNPDSVISRSPREMEGIVCRPKVELKDRCGRRMIVKIKWNDVKDMLL